MLITDQVATAPCTDPIQQRILTFEAKLRRDAENAEIAQRKAMSRVFVQSHSEDSILD